jgi:hypothetical protein
MDETISRFSSAVYTAFNSMSPISIAPAVTYVIHSEENPQRFQGESTPKSPELCSPATKVTERAGDLL